MGLGLYTKASLTVGKQILTGRPRTLTADDLQKACNDFLAGTPLDEFKSFDELWDGKPGFSLGFHPAEEGIDFHLEGTDVFVAAKTSSAGPGYHAFSVSLLEHLQATLQITWQFGGENDEFQDEAGYWHDRDAARLQETFANFMAQLFRMCLDKRKEGASAFRLGMPVDFGVVLPEQELRTIGAFTQLGPFGWTEIERGASTKANERDAVAARYFPWWEQGFGADFHAKLGLLDMWMHQAWTTPSDERERKHMQRALGWFATARKLDPAMVLPDLAIAELGRLARSTEQPVLSQPGLIGYRRQLMPLPLTGHWRVTVPGCLSEIPTEDTGKVIYAVSNFQVFGSSYRLSAVGDEQLPSGDAAGEPLFTQADLRGNLDAGTTDEPQGFTMTAVANTPTDGKTRERGLVTIWYIDETLKPLATQVARSLAYDPPKQT
jgi:hypothetical protein